MDSEDVKFNDKFVDLVDIRKSISNCDEHKLSQVLSLLPSMIELDIVQSILFCGLHQCLPQIPVQNMQTLKNNINDILNETTNTAAATPPPPPPPPNSVYNLSIFDLHDDVLVYLCQFLDIFTILNMEKTSRFFVSIARHPLSCSRFTMEDADDDYDDPEMKLSLSPIHMDDHTVTPWQCIPSSRYSSFSFSTSINFPILIHQYLNNTYHFHQLQSRYSNAKQLHLNMEHFKSTKDLKSCTRLIHAFNHLKQLKITFSKNTDTYRQNDLLLLKGLPTLQSLQSLKIVHRFGPQMIHKLKTNRNQLETLVVQNLDITKSVIKYINKQHHLQHFEWNHNCIDYALHTRLQQWKQTVENGDDGEQQTYYTDHLAIINNFFHRWCHQRDSNVFSFQCCVKLNQFTFFLNELIEHLASNLFQFSFQLEGDDDFIYQQRMNDMACAYSSKSRSSSAYIRGNIAPPHLMMNSRDTDHWKTPSVFQHTCGAEFKCLRILNLTFPLEYYRSIQSVLRRIPNYNMLRLIRIHVSIDSRYDGAGNGPSKHERNEAIESRFTEILYESFNKLKDMALNPTNSKSNKRSLHLVLTALCSWTDVTVLFDEMMERFKGIKKRIDTKLSVKPRLKPKQSQSVPLYMGLDEEKESPKRCIATARNKGCIHEWILYKEVFGNNVINDAFVDSCCRLYHRLHQYFNGRCHWLKICDIGIMVKSSQKIDLEVIKRKQLQNEIQIKISADAYYIMFGVVDSYQHWN